jgi:hypothetical protein
MYTDENYVSRCRERMPALLYNRVSRELVLRFVSCRFVSLTNHTSVGVVRDRRVVRKAQLTKVKGGDKLLTCRKNTFASHPAARTDWVFFRELSLGFVS